MVEPERFLFFSDPSGELQSEVDSKDHVWAVGGGAGAPDMSGEYKWWFKSASVSLRDNRVLA